MPDQPDEVEFVIPEDLTTLSDEQLAELHAQATQHFDAIYGDGTGLAPESLTALSVLTEGIESLMREMDTRAEAARAREAEAAALAARIHPVAEAPPTPPEGGEAQEGEGEQPQEPAPEGTAPEAPAPAPAPADVVEPIAAGAGRREIRVNVAGLHSRQTPRALPRPAHQAQSMRDVVLASGDGTGYAQGEGVEWDDLGRIVDRRLQGFNEAQYEQANQRGQHLTQQHGVATFRIPFQPEAVLASADPQHVRDVLKAAVDETKLPGGSLVASGGWCAPSETLYDLCEMESRDGLLSLPTINVTRGGISWTPGPDFASIWTAGAGFHYLEADDVAGNYGGTPGARTTGSKPCYKVPCPSFTEARLEPDGLCITAGLLQQRGYPEVISRTVRGALVAHDHIVSQNQILGLVTGSTAVTMTTGTLGTVAPLLDAIEKQVEHYRYSQRLARGTTLEAIFPYWIRAAIRSDIALRAGSTDNLSVTDAQVNAWFASRGIQAQFVYDWQAITGNGEDFKTWPATVRFLLYAAGVWALGQQDVITLDTLYDSVLLGTNDYVALFTENAWLLAKLCHDSRVVTVPVCSNGSTGAPITLTCDGTTAVIGDQTRPVAGTIAGSAIGATGFTLTVTGASDAGVGLDAEPYRFSTDGGVTWTEWQTSNVKAVTGLTTGTLYHTRGEVRDKNGNTSTTPVVNVTTS